MRRTPLHWACQNGHVKAVETLVQYGADVNAKGRNWAKLVQGQACGQLVAAEPCEECPKKMCKNCVVALALEKPEWTPQINDQFPDKFKKLVRFFCLVVSQNKKSQQSSWPLDSSLTLTILQKAAYPISVWLEKQN
eukprot:TRINITY_DN29637_c2_g1_i1.p2 TRINITY_DN29637_c2_g1~~TRINITY_DN29637_c2_g1_i1.p2  ORF type:complete len:154 (-),score=19.99 TRINITY_DN29637_c2_g1_i1:497-904(-)